MDIKEKIKSLPNSPGVYLMKDKDNRIIYVGKASLLRKRVASYFKGSAAYSPRHDALRSHIRDIDYISTSTTAEALIYEAALIKKNQPRYNIELKDDKSYPFLKLTLNEAYPRLMITRRKKNDGARYYGPYPNVKLLRKALGLMRRIFPLRTCLPVGRHGQFPKHACLNYHIGQCLGPCIGRINERDYREVVRDITLFLEGRKDELLNSLAKKMAQASEEKNFEQAARIRDQIQSLVDVIKKRKGLGGISELKELKQVLGLPAPPEKIEAFDISNIQGTEAVGSMVSFHRGRAYKQGFRRFRIKHVREINDYEMIKEVVRRRYKHAWGENLPLPDLIIIDGGKGHLSTVEKELSKLGLANIPVIGIAKGEERIYLTKRKTALTLPRGSKALYLIQRIRNQAHRFAIGYHHTLRSKLVTLSSLDCVPGIGPGKKRDLIKHFGPIDKIKKAGLGDLTKVKGISEKIAKNIIEYLTLSPPL